MKNTCRIVRPYWLLSKNVLVKVGEETNRRCSPVVVGKRVCIKKNISLQLPAFLAEVSSEPGGRLEISSFEQAICAGVEQMIEELSGDFFQQMRGFYYTAHTGCIR